MGTGCREMKSKQAKQANRRGTSALWAILVGVLLVGPAPFMGGCAFIQKPEPDPTPTPVPDVFRDPNVFQSTTEAIKGEMLNDSSGATKTKPHFYRLTSVEAGDLLNLQGIVASGNSEALFDKPLAVKLAGIIAPRPGQAGWQESAAAASNWLSGRKLNVQQDQKFQMTVDGRKVVLVTFTGTGKFDKQEMSFNQLMVRSGFAWVYLTSISSFDYKQWVRDEEYARGIRAPLSAEDKERAKKANKGVLPKLDTQGRPVGLWAKNIRPPFRVPPRGYVAAPLAVESVPVPTAPPVTNAGGTGESSSGSSEGSSSPPSTSESSPPSSSGNSVSVR